MKSATHAVEADASFVVTPDMPALSRHVLGGSDARPKLIHTVRRLQREPDGNWVVETDEAPGAGPFDRAVLAIPPAQAAVLLAGHRDAWVESLGSRRMAPCWTLMAVTDDVDTDWDIAEPARGPIARVLRNDRMPGRSAPVDSAAWTVHASAEWSILGGELAGRVAL